MCKSSYKDCWYRRAQKLKTCRLNLQRVHHKFRIIVEIHDVAEFLPSMWLIVPWDLTLVYIPSITFVKGTRTLLNTISKWPCGASKMENKETREKLAENGPEYLRTTSCWIIISFIAAIKLSVLNNEEKKAISLQQSLPTSYVKLASIILSGGTMLFSLLGSVKLTRPLVSGSCQRPNSSKVHKCRCDKQTWAGGSFLPTVLTSLVFSLFQAKTTFSKLRVTCW